jgi:hypothetical protein
VKRSAAVDDKHLPISGLSENLFDQHIILVALHGSDDAAEPRARSEIPELEIA